MNSRDDLNEYSFLVDKDTKRNLINYSLYGIVCLASCVVIMIACFGIEKLL
jgi:hypothetical protein